MIRAVLRKELTTLWTSPVPYVVGALFHAALGVLAVDTLRAREQAVFRPVVPIAGFLILAVAPALAMRAFAEERRTGTLDVLLAIPVRASSLVVGKWVAVFLSTLAIASPAALHALLLVWWGEPDTGTIASATAGLVLLAAFCTALGVLASALTSSLPVAALAGLFVSMLSWFLRPSTAAATLRTLGARLSLSERLRTFAGGGIDSGDAVFLVVVSAGFLVGATVAVDGLRATARRRRFLVLAAAAVAVVATTSVADAERRLVDLTDRDTLSLSEPTQDLLDSIRERTRITAFLAADAPGRDEAAALLDRYQRGSRHVSARVVSPRDAPGDVRRTGIDPTFGGVAVESGGRIEVAAAPTEQDISLAIARLERGELPQVCIATGHGELDPDSTLPNGFASAVELLAGNGYEVVAIDLLARPEVPEPCAAVVLAAPAADLDEAATALARWYERDDGRLLVLAEVGFDAGLEQVLSPTGIELLEGVVVEGDPESVIEGDATAPIIRRYSAVNPVVRGLPPTFLVGTGGLSPDESDDVAGRAVSRLADTSASSLLVSDPDGDTSDARPGPITVIASSDTSANVGGTIRRSRAVVVADGDFASNAFVGEAANGQLLVQSLDWLTVDEALVSVPSNLARPRLLELTDARRSYAILLTAGIVPGLFLVAGAFVWAVRRSR